jgi:hypothetical protein
LLRAGFLLLIALDAHSFAERVLIRTPLTRGARAPSIRSQHGAQLHATNAIGWTPLHYAAHRGCVWRVRRRERAEEEPKKRSFPFRTND